MINNVVLVGRLTKDVDLRYTQSGTAVGNFTLAVNRAFANAQGQREADFINCVIWRKSAENLAKYTSKGSLIGVEGSIQTRNYENQQGQRVYVTEVVVDNFTFLESKKDSQQRGQDGGSSDSFSSFNAPSNQGQSNNTYNSYNSSPSNDFSNNSYPVNDDPFAGNNSGPVDISEDDLPF